MIEISIDALIKGIGALSLVLVILSVYIILKNTKDKAVDRKTKAYIQSKQDLWYRYFNGEITLPSELIPNNKTEMKAIEEIFLAYIQNISNANIREKIRDFSNQYLKRYYLDLLQSKKWSLRMNALYRVIDFKIDSLAAECKKMAKKADLSAEERFQLLIIHSIFDKKGFTKVFINLSVKLSEYEYKKLLTHFDPEILEQLTNQIDEFPTTYQYYFIDMLGVVRNLDFVPFLEEQLEHENPEIRIRALKAMNEIGIISSLDKYKTFLNSPIWEERLMLAKLLRAFPLEQVYPYLEKLLQDKNWWVRFHAAQTIGSSKDGKAKLKTFIKTAQDQYAVDMACEVLGGDID